MTSPDDVADEIAPGVMVGEYRIEGTLGQGGMATVYAALHPLIGKRAAIKVVSRRLLDDAAATERFVQEAQAVNRIGHPNIVDVFSIGTLPDGRPYFVMEWLKGESLGARLGQGPLAIDEAVDVLNQLCLALEAVHEVGIIHRDLKPDNIFLVPVRGRPTPVVKLLDFGVAKLRQSEGMTRVTATGMAVGTPAYVSPEQARGLEVDPRSDIYSLGVIAYELVTGKIPFDAESALDVMMMHVQAPPPRLRVATPDAPQSLEDLVVTMMAKTPDARPSLPEIRDTLATLATVSPPAPRASSSLSLPVRTNAALAATLSTERLPKRHRSWLGRFLAALVVLGGAIAIVMYVRANEVADVRSNNAPAVAIDAAAPVPQTVPDAAEATRPAMLILRVTTAGARIELDGVPVAGARDGTELVIERPGTHVITASARGHQPLRQAVDVLDAQTVEVAIALEPLPRRKAQKPKPPGPQKPRGDNYTLDPFKQRSR